MQLLTYINIATLNIRILVARVKVIGIIIGILEAFEPVCDIQTQYCIIQLVLRSIQNGVFSYTDSYATGVSQWN